jgi:hypothetical protein
MHQLRLKLKSGLNSQAYVVSTCPAMLSSRYFCPSLEIDTSKYAWAVKKATKRSGEPTDAEGQPAILIAAHTPCMISHSQQLRLTSQQRRAKLKKRGRA